MNVPHYKDEALRRTAVLAFINTLMFPFLDSFIPSHIDSMFLSYLSTPAPFSYSPTAWRKKCSDLDVSLEAVLRLELHRGCTQ